MFFRTSAHADDNFNYALLCRPIARFHLGKLFAYKVDLLHETVIFLVKSEETGPFFSKKCTFLVKSRPPY